MPLPLAEQIGQATLSTTLDEVPRLKFIIAQMLARVQTVSLVEVVGVSNDSDLAPVGTVDVRPMVHQMSGDGKAVPHGIIYKLPYMRMQGGSSAVIIDPKVGDIGMAAFCSRDISTVVETKKPALPASLRKFNWSDGLYIGGFLNQTPTQYIRFADNGLFVFSPSKIKLDAPSVAATKNLSVGTGATGVFTSATGQIITVADGIITQIL